MKESIEKYIQDISEKFKHAETSELGYRSDFESLLQKIFESIKYKRFNHDAKAKEGNKPDFAVLSGDVPLVYIETKDIGVSLDKVEKSEQMSRYYGYANLVLTDYLEFRFYRNGLPYGEPVKIANYDIKTRSVDPISDNYDLLAKTLLDFTQSYKEPIKSGKHLSKIMAGKAQRIRDNIRQFLSAELENKTELVKLYDSIKKFLVHDLTIDSFADMYAQTLVYGLFIARFNDTTLDSFTRSEARDLIPNSNPFLHRFFDHIAGTDFDTRLKFIVDELCEVFSHSNIEELLKQFSNEDLWGKAHKKPDPVIYFYENFLKEYDPVLRKKMGAYYTPEPVVQFIVRAVDHILRNDFKLTGGLGDTSKTKNSIHKVQILDPATGTGTFISAIIRNIYINGKFNSSQEGRWPGYVHYNLLPRLYGFEIMMTPYTIAHLKLSLALKETGFHTFYETKKGKSRLGIYLTNALEGESAQQDMFSAVGLSESIAEESIEASKIKNEKLVMVVVGNPPYSISSSNKSEWIQNLIKVYKENLNEKKINLDDDYIKFLRFAEHFIEKNKTGIVAMITNNSFIDGITHRQMRKHLLETFDEIYILDLHGNSKKKERAPDGRKDENIFDIQQGVSINIFVRKNENKTKLGTVYHSEIFGKREYKFETLNKSDIEKIKWQKLNYSKPYFFFVPKDFQARSDYENGFKLEELFQIYSVGIGTKVDSISIDFDKDSLKSRVMDILNKKYEKQELITKFDLGTNTTWEYDKALTTNFSEDKLIIYDYRPFDSRYIFYDHNFLSRSRKEVMENFFNKNNYGLELGKTSFITFISKNVSDEHFGGPKSYKFPLYVYFDNGSYQPNLKKELVDKVEKITGDISPENLFDYIYAVLHSPNYREKYKEFLKISFPVIPYPKDKDQFNKLVKFGEELRELHLLESSKLNNFITSFNVGGSDIVEKVEYKNGNVYINETQFFGDVPEIAWIFYIGGYQPAQKWLKVRKGRYLTDEDIEHYQKIIVALAETDKIMKEINNVYPKINEILIN